LPAAFLASFFFFLERKDGGVEREIMEEEGGGGEVWGLYIRETRLQGGVCFWGHLCLEGVGPT
jgi:hypothetical protein